MPRLYATPADLGPSPPEDAEKLLASASRMLDARVLRYCMYDVDEDGYPSNEIVRAAVRDVVCAQVRWWEELGDSSGASAAGWGNVQIGSVRLGRSVTTTAGEDAPARQLAPEAVDALLDPDLTADIFVMGVVFS